jgi:thiol-disulfide isomerase/thioredoxin
VKLVLVLAVVFLLAATLAGCGAAPSYTPIAAPIVGRPAPDFSWDKDGEIGLLGKGEESLSGLQGHVVIVYFFATWCPHCREQTPVLQSLYEGQKDAGLIVLGVNVGEGQTDVAKYKDELGLTFSIVRDSQVQVIENYWGRGVPLVLLLDREGMIQARWEGPQDRETIERELVPLLGR